ncbi:MAG: hypothetical protein VSS75_012225 [Candidatus Parabeggiatoa sp.]|nr:hypothetical protein [Candidatus Parabeggiatoa sp.]
MTITSRVILRPLSKLKRRWLIGQFISLIECPFCNERGLVRFVDKCTGRFENTPCPHDPVEIEDMRKGRQIDAVKSSQFKSIGEILSRRDKEVDEVPF